MFQVSVYVTVCSGTLTDMTLTELKALKQTTRDVICPKWYLPSRACSCSLSFDSAYFQQPHFCVNRKISTPPESLLAIPCQIFIIIIKDPKK